MIKLKTYKTAQAYINVLEENAKELERIEAELKGKQATINKTLAKLRAYKKRGIVEKVSKYHYIIKGQK